MNLQDWEAYVADQLSVHGFDQPRFEARQLLQGALHLSESEYLLRQLEELDESAAAKIAAWLGERASGKPLAYLIGEKGFYKSTFKVESGVLIPRPETEHVVERALLVSKSAKTIADLGCGSGCIGLSLALEMPAARLWSLDVSPIACRVTKTNASNLGLSDRVTIVNASVQNWQPPQSFELVVANPPYVAKGDARVEANVHQFEPHVALYSGAEGLDAIRNWTTWAFRHLHAGGHLVMEFGSGQTGDVRAIMEEAGFQNLAVDRDLAGHERVISAAKPTR